MWSMLGGLQVNRMCFTGALSFPSPTMSLNNEFARYAPPKKRKLDELESLNTESPRRNEFAKFVRGDGENSSSPNQDATHAVLLDLQMAHRLFERPLTKKQFDKLKDDLQLSLQIRLKQLLESKQACEDVLEMADSAYVLMLLNSSNPKGEEARRAIMLFQEGERLITDGQHLLKSAFPDVFTATD
ncbi:uncharacterized protein LOC100855022 [Vitis vinifera]|uniref:Uncharacterized protein n=2 Tax=Vitis vinifera TaxID=29760 RepID=A0A438EA70_VITVI|eukprot:XP_003632657.1 PREDICTED: uncharacterized protein LOC100855022 [Vitis vinifera]